MNEIYVPFGTQHNTENDDTVEILRRIGAKRVFVTPVVRIPFQKCEKRTELLNRMKSQIAFFKENGFKAGTWSCSLGYGGEVEHYTKESAQGFMRRVGVNGSVADDAFCPSDKNFTAAMCSIIRDLGETGADMIMLDDELTLTAVSSLGCVCENHMKMFNERVCGNFKTTDIKDIVFSGKPGKYRDAWLDITGETLIDFCKSLRDALDEVDPNIRMGFASGYTSWDLDGVDAITLTKVLAGGTKPFLRLTGAPYWFSARRFGKQPLANIIETCRQQYAWCKDENIDLFTEADVFPRSRFYTPAAISEAFDIGTKLSDSCDVLKYFTDYISWHERGYIDAHERNRGVYDDISKYFDNKNAVGIRVYSKMKTVRDATLSETFQNAADISDRWYKHTPTIPCVNAIPTTYCGGEYPSIAFGENARDLDEDAFKNGMIIDISAAEILQESGIDVGLSSAEPKRIYQERFDDYDLTFNFYCDKGSYKIVADEKAKVLSRLSGNGFESPGAYLYKNANKQRFLVYAFNAYDALLHSGFRLAYGRGRQLNDAVDWLCGKRLPAECNDIPMLYCICKEDEKSVSLGYLLCTEDEAFDVSVRINVAFDPNSVKFINCKGKMCDDGNVVIEHIKGFGFVGIAFDKK